MRKEYIPSTPAGKIGWLVEECGEVVQACGKLIRFGVLAFNPEVPIEARETNRDALLRELQDLKAAIATMEEWL